MSVRSTQLIIADGPAAQATLPAVPARPAQPVSPHLVPAGQRILFGMRRDWRPLAGLHRHELPALTPAAQQLITALVQHAEIQRWSPAPAKEAVRTLWILLAWLGADAPAHEADVYDLAQLSDKLAPNRVSQFLESRGLLIRDLERRRDKDEDRVERIISRYPDQVAAELRRWVAVLRGEGRRSHPHRSYYRIHRYLSVITPVLDTWTRRAGSMREITRADIEAAIMTRQGNPAKALHVSLRSLFRALKQERMVFRDPSRGVTFPTLSFLPASIASDQLAGLIDQARTPMDKLIVALVAIHALTGTDLQNLQTRDLNLAAGKLLVRRGHRPHTVYLDELTCRLAAAWLAERRRRWPACASPHLLVTRLTAMVTRHPPVTDNVFRKTFKQRGLTAQQVRQDRILDEARHTADPVHLVRVFGISESTAINYVYAAHLGRQSVIPR